jgi:hypothetical protein
MNQSHPPHQPELAAIIKRYDALAGHLDEKSLRLAEPARRWI